MTREEAIKYLSEEQKKTEEVVALTERDFGVSESVWHTEYEAFNLAIAALREQPQWISVEERLPEDDLPSDTDRVAITVLAVTTHGKRRFVRELTRQRWWWKGVMQPWSWSKDARGVTHWMPLPEAPKEEV